MIKRIQEMSELSKDALKTIDEILEQNRLIIRQNAMLLQYIVNPILVVDEPLVVEESLCSEVKT